MRVAVVGNSHITALRYASQQDPTLGGVDFVFFGASVMGDLPGLHVDQGLLRSDHESVRLSMARSSRQPALVLADYDALVLMGMLRESRGLVSLYARYQAESHQGEAGRRVLVSDCLFRELALAECRQSLAVRVAREVHATTTMPLAIVPHPWASEGIVDSPLPAHRPWVDVLEREDNGHLSELFHSINDEVAEGFTFLRQPESTLARPFFTDRAFTLDGGALRSSAANPVPDDYFHMNTTFGTIALESLVQWLLTNVPSGGAAL